MTTVMTEPELNDADHAILDMLSEGRNVPANMADDLDVSRQYVHQRIKILETADYVHNIGRGVYELVEDPRDNNE